ncbi:MAG TPA: mersacidin/lichenicidin family type 2 lantibiotic [Pyrinomonadaceae bacterium]|nr:mersacidin/lichenicidin family type 2 lantibiotic [Pyrinomonadaceae bacterium]
MSELDIIRAWKDEDYADSLTDVQRAMLPQNPAGIIELSDRDLEGAAGGQELIPLLTLDDFCISLMYSCITLGCTVTIGISALEA